MILGTSDMEREFLTIKEVAEFLSISIGSVHNLIKRGELEAIRMPGWRIPRASLETKIKKERNRNKAA